MFIMKNLKWLIFACLFSLKIMSASAQYLDNYKYIRFNLYQDPYNIGNTLYDAFANAGFQIVSNNEYEQMNMTDKALTLLAEYNYWVGRNDAYSGIQVCLDNRMHPIWESYQSVHGSSKSVFRKMTKNIVADIERSHYHFNPNPSPSTEHPYAYWNEDSIMNYLRSQTLLPIEGIYQEYEDNIKIAILQHHGNFFGITLSPKGKNWKKYRTQIRLKPIDDNLYDATFDYYFSERRKKLGTLSGRSLEFSYGKYKHEKFVKVYPPESQGKKTAKVGNGQCKATGSGVLISDNIVITNYHVIEDANRVEAVVNVNGVPETYNARVLCSDKTNDLAIVCIKDENFKGQGEVPFKIVPNTIDVGTSVFTMGFPLATFLGDEVKITDGIVSSKTGYDGDVVTYQISAPIQPGNSGGPLFDKSGNLVGITNAGIDKSVADNVGYAIKTPYVLSLMDSAPITIPVPNGKNMVDRPLPELVKMFIPFVVYIKIY